MKPGREAHRAGAGPAGFREAVPGWRVQSPWSPAVTHPPLPPLFFLFPLRLFLRIIFRLVSCRPGSAAPARAVPGGGGPRVPVHPQAAAAPPAGAHAVGATAPERAGPAAPGDPAAAPAVPGEAQAAVSAAAAAPQQGGCRVSPRVPGAAARVCHQAAHSACSPRPRLP